jgi:hypothetical protein
VVLIGEVREGKNTGFPCEVVFGGVGKALQAGRPRQKVKPKLMSQSVFAALRKSLRFKPPN